MCLIVFSYKNTPGFRLILAANRDEFLDRPTGPLDYFNDEKTIAAGKDLQGGGTWLGINKQGYFSAITNYRSPESNTTKKTSRGVIIPSYLDPDLKKHPRDFLEDLVSTGAQYSGFNLLAGNNDVLYFTSNVTNEVQLVAPGLYGLSNHLLDTAWPKVALVKSMVEVALDGPQDQLIGSLFSMLEDTTMPDDNDLPKTGVGLTWERYLAPIFINAPGYGTRSSAVLCIRDDNEISFVEKTYTHSPEGIQGANMRSIEFRVGGSLRLTTT